MTMSALAATKRKRCSIYTRKSTEEGLEQEFNSLDVQRESAEAFIKSQAQEGWVCLPEHYDDGGYTGGNMERPALQGLLEDIRAKKVDVVVVYKVDRLSRSLLDFARIMEIFEKHELSFASITQQFNSTHSLPLLTFVILAFWNVIFVPMLKFIGLAFIKGPVGAGAVSLYGIAVASGTYGYRSYSSYNFTKNQYSLQLTRSLYYQNLDNNSGVFYSLLNEAEQQEWREAILGYYCLLKSALPEGFASAQLDDCVEEMLEQRAGLKVDFEIGDAMKKLERLRLVRTDKAGRYQAIPMTEAIERLHEAWDGQFRKAMKGDKLS